jgi:hypothetical protein
MAKPSSLYAIFKDYGKSEMFRCDGCQRVLSKKWSDDDAIAEMQQRFPGVDTSNVLLLCDDCVDKVKLKTSV